VQSHPKLGASWEGFALEQVIGVLESRDLYFWATQAGAELDLLLRIRGRQYGFEFKYADAPGTTRSMHIAVQDLALEHLWVIYPGHQEYSLDNKISVFPVDSIPRLADTLRGER
jgi:predicted AAA+ superfamily ATPase